MRKRSRIDDVQNARRVVEKLIGAPLIQPTKDPIAVELGRRGGLKGGKARAAKMTVKERSESARQASIARWKAQKKEL